MVVDEVKRLIGEPKVDVVVETTVDLRLEEAAEKAFFEKSMVGQVYFPDEHKVAVYLPLLGPVGVPLVMSVLKELKAWRKRKRDRI